MVIESTGGDGVNCTGCIYTSGNGETTTQCRRRRRPWYDIASRLSRVECIRGYITLCKGWLLHSIKPPRCGHGNGKTRTQCRRPWSDLPNDILISIASRLGRVEYIRFMAVCKGWLHSIKPPRCGHGNGKTTTQCRRPWSDLPNDILISIASRLGGVECIRFMAVCKGWLHSIKPHGHDRNHRKPCLLVMENSGGWLSLYTPFPNNSKTYKLKIPELKETRFRFSKDGWILLSKSSSLNCTLFLLNMLTGAKFDLPYMVPTPNGYMGICFTSTPGSSDFMVFVIAAVLAERVTIFTYRPSTTTCTDLKYQNWTAECYKNSSTTSFLDLSCNPVFYKGKFYCLDHFGHLGIFDPVRKNWTTLDRPNCISVNPALRYFPFESFMVDFEGDLVSVFVNENRNTAAPYIFRLDCCKMSWEKVNSLGTGELFLGRTSISTVEVPYGSWNKLYFPAFPSSNPTVEVPYCSIWNKFKFSAYRPSHYDAIFSTYDDVVCRAYSLETKAYDDTSCFRRDPLLFIWIEIPMSKWESIFHSKWKRI